MSYDLNRKENDHEPGDDQSQFFGRDHSSEETIKIGSLEIRFLLTGDDSNGSVSVFEVLVPVGQKLAAPTHKNDAYEEIRYGIEGILAG
jgi:hypothetical protein